MSLLAPAHIVFLQKGWQAFSGFITALLAAHFLSPEEQGYYYVFGSLLSGYVLLDLGLSGLLVQISARMFLGLELRAGGQLAPPGVARSSFLTMVAWSRRWYAKTSLLTLLLIPIGFVYFSYAKTGVQGIGWQWPWVLIVIASVLSVSTYSTLSIIEGTGRVAEVYWVRLGHYALGALMAWALLVGGKGLYAPAMPPLAIALTTVLWFRLRYRGLLEDASQNHGFSWRDEVWPLQKRVALFWLASYIFLNAPTLVVFYFSDAVSAGQLGLTSVIANILGSLCASWLIAKVPHITNLVSLGRDADSKSLFSKGFVKALLLMTLGYVAAVLAVILAGHLSIAQRLLPPLETALLFAMFAIFHSIGMLSVHFRARGREVLAYPLLIATSLALTVSCLIAPGWGTIGVIMAYLFAYALICIPAMILGWKGMQSA
jgi:hypothetical protein